MPRLRRAVILSVCTLIVAGLAGFALADPFHLRHARWFTAGLVLLAILLAVTAFAVVARRGLLRGSVLVVGGVAVVGWVVTVALATQVTTPGRDVLEVADGGRRLVVVEGSATASGPVYAVVLRAGGGAFEQESIVYQGVDAAPAPAGVRFVDSDTVEVRSEEGCLYRSNVEVLTLVVDPVHRPLGPGAC